MKKGLGFIYLLALCSALQAQVVTYFPQYPTLQDSVEIIFNAASGNAGLNGAAQVYMHTGTISEVSLNTSDWRHRINPWPTGDPDLVINDSLVMMTPLGNNLHRVKIKPNSFYGTNSNFDYNALAFVFRNLNGSAVGKNADGSDVFIPIFKTPNFDAFFFKPLTTAWRVDLNAAVPIQVLSNRSATITLFLDNVQINQVSNATVLNTSVNANSPGKHWLRFVAVSGSTTITDSIYYVVNQATTQQNPPFASMNGVNYVNDSTVLLQLYAPGKNFAYVIGDFNDWQIDPAYQMRKTLDGTALWVEISGLTPQQEYRFQYVVDQDVVIADPWAEKYLDEFNDANIFFFTYPNLIDYPTGKTNGMVSVLQTAQTPFNWQHSNNFSRPFSQDLVIYEMWLHDFILRHDYATLKDTLDYLQNLGVNVIELMPINEFDGNEAWGYGPAFYFAPDKYYGPKEDLKEFIDECHRRGIAVVLDVVFNHAFGQNTMARLYMDKNSNKPTNDNPWFNSYIPHPYGYYSDFDHSSLETQYFIDRCLYHWLTEYKIDGYRFDLSKGFSNVYSYPNNLGLWGNYDADRVYWLKRIFNQVRSFDPNCYMILEHFAENTEEVELANHGFLLWGNANHQYKEAAMGYQNGSDFKWAVSSKHRGWPYQHLVGYMESHDEERLMYECKEYGNMMISNGDTLYNVRADSTALKRMETCAAFFFTVPGPKMIWQFGELGYDYSINFNGRTNSKPIRWNYLQQANRLRLYKAYAAMIKLKTNNPAFRTANYDMDTWGYGKRLWVTDPSMNVTVIGNFDVTDLNGMSPGFQHTGMWYDYMTGDSILVNDVNAAIPLEAGEYHIYTDVRLNTPDLTVTNIRVDNVSSDLSAQVYPNPFSSTLIINYKVPNEGKIIVRIYDIKGNLVKELVSETLASGEYLTEWDGKGENGGIVPAGNYFLSVQQMSNLISKQIIKID